MFTKLLHEYNSLKSNIPRKCVQPAGGGIDEITLPLPFKSAQNVWQTEC
jgi:hypothetical protein